MISSYDRGQFNHFVNFVLPVNLSLCFGLLICLLTSLLNCLLLSTYLLISYPLFKVETPLLPYLLARSITYLLPKRFIIFADLLSCLLIYSLTSLPLTSHPITYFIIYFIYQALLTSSTYLFACFLTCILLTSYPIYLIDLLANILFTYFLFTYQFLTFLLACHLCTSCLASQIIT